MLNAVIASSPVVVAPANTPKTWLRIGDVGVALPSTSPTRRLTPNKRIAAGASRHNTAIFALQQRSGKQDQPNLPSIAGVLPAAAATLLTTIAAVQLFSAIAPVPAVAGPPVVDILGEPGKQEKAREQTQKLQESTPDLPSLPSLKEVGKAVKDAVPDKPPSLQDVKQSAGEFVKGTNPLPSDVEEKIPSPQQQKSFVDSKLKELPK